jgi:hypothetical protein
MEEARHAGNQGEDLSLLSKIEHVDAVFAWAEIPARLV